MKRILPLAIATLLAAQQLVAPRAVSAQNVTPPACTSRVIPPEHIPNVWIFSNDRCWDFSQYISSVIPGLTWRLQTPLLNLLGATLQLNVLFDSDPSITVAFSSTTLTSSTTFSAFFYTPVVPDFYTSASAQGMVSITSGITGSGAVLTDPGTNPFFLSGDGLVGTIGTSLGVGTGTAPCTATATVLPVTNQCSYGPVFSTFSPRFYDGLLASLVYQQTGIGSFASWTGTVTLDNTPVSVVPEPSSLLLLTAGLAIIAVPLARRRRTNS